MNVLNRKRVRLEIGFTAGSLYGLFPLFESIAHRARSGKIGAQFLGLDRLAERLGLTRLLPERLRRMQRLLPELKRREPQLPEFLPAIAARRARVALLRGVWPTPCFIMSTGPPRGCFRPTAAM